LEGGILRRPDIPAVLSKLAASSNPVEVIRDLVLRTGGFWQDTVEASGLFEIQLAGITGLGSSAQAAVEDWIIQARRAKVEDLWVALEEG
jgi:hypothetical protein